MEPNSLFVYGTLRKGHGNHFLMEGATFVGFGTVKGKLPTGSIMLQKSKIADAPGELYENLSEAAWEEIDALEGHPFTWKREIVT